MSDAAPYQLKKALNALILEKQITDKSTAQRKLAQLFQQNIKFLYMSQHIKHVFIMDPLSHTQQKKPL